MNSSFFLNKAMNEEPVKTTDDDDVYIYGPMYREEIEKAYRYSKIRLRSELSMAFGPTKYKRMQLFSVKDVLAIVEQLGPWELRRKRQ